MANDLTLNLKVTADGKSVAPELTRVVDAVEGIGQGARDAKPSIDGLGAAVDRLGEGAPDAARVGESIDSVGDSAAAARPKVDTLGTAVDRVGDEAASSGGAFAGFIDQFAPVGKAALGLNEMAEAFGRIAGVAGDVLATADAYKQMSSRLSLAVGEGEALAQALEQVRGIANKSGADLEATATLYTRLAQATKDLGFTQSQVAALTDTINKSFAVSGASAAEAEGAIRQFAQGLASGALRGDEFNSVMEQSPRLSQALAAGLGVGIGELRNMAEQGKLTAEVVTKALQSQAAAIEADFGKMPDTVGRATQRLKNEWAVFLGELDKTSGASETVASALNGVAGNLDTIADMLALTGVAAASAFGPSLTKSIYAAGSELVSTTATAGGLRAALQSIPRNIGITVAITGAVALLQEIIRASDGAKKTFAEASRISEEGGARAERMARQIALAVGGMRTALTDLVAPETQGYIRLFEGITAGAQTAEEKTKLTAEALDAMSQALDRGSESSIKGFGEAMERLVVNNQLSADLVRSTWETTLASLSGAQLADFTSKAESAFGQGWKGAIALATVMDVSLRNSIAASGQDWDQLSTGIGSAAASAIGHVDNLAAHADELGSRGLDAGAALAGALNQAIAAADTVQAIAAVTARVESLGQQGAISGQALTAALEAARRKADELTPGINSVEEAFRALGLTSQTALDAAAAKARSAYDIIVGSGLTSTDQLNAAWAKYASAALAAGDATTREIIRMNAEMHGYTVAVNAAGVATVQAMGAAAASTREVAAETSQAADQTGRLADQTGRLADESERAAAAAAALISASKRSDGGIVYDKMAVLSDLQSYGLSQEQAASLVAGASESVNQRDGNAIVRSIADNLGINTRAGVGMGVRDIATQVLLSGANAGAAPGTSTTHRVVITLPTGGSTTINTASAGDAATLSGLFRQLEGILQRS